MRKTGKIQQIGVFLLLTTKIMETITQQTFICIQCGLEKPIESSGGTGYGLDKDNNKTCYACIGINDRKELENAKPGDKFIHYLTNTEVTNWPGTFRVNVSPRVGRHNIAGKRYDVWFSVGKNNFHGVTFGDMTQICHIKCVKYAKF